MDLRSVDSAGGAFQADHQPRYVRCCLARLCGSWSTQRWASLASCSMTRLVALRSLPSTSSFWTFAWCVQASACLNEQQPATLAICTHLSTNADERLCFAVHREAAAVAGLGFSMAPR